MSDTRFAARRGSVRRKRWKRVAIATAVVAVLALVAWLVLLSRVLAVSAIEIDGQTSLKAAQVRSSAEIPSGRPLARVDTVAVESRIASMERVQAVEVTRSWPQTISIEVVERTPVVWVLVGGTIRGVDRFGVDFRTYSKAPKGLLEAQVTVSGARDRQQTLEAVASVVDLIDEKDRSLRKAVQSISADTKDSLVLDLTDGRVVTWGSRADGDRKLTVLKALLRLDATTYDVSAPDQPTTKK